LGITGQQKYDATPGSQIPSIFVNIDRHWKRDCNPKPHRLDALEFVQGFK
jgi:hypothetical protein